MELAFVRHGQKHPRLWSCIVHSKILHLHEKKIVGPAERRCEFSWNNPRDCFCVVLGNAHPLSRPCASPDRVVLNGAAALQVRVQGSVLHARGVLDPNSFDPVALHPPEGGSDEGPPQVRRALQAHGARPGRYGESSDSDSWIKLHVVTMNISAIGRLG